MLFFYIVPEPEVTLNLRSSLSIFIFMIHNVYDITFFIWRLDSNY